MTFSDEGKFKALLINAEQNETKWQTGKPWRRGYVMWPWHPGLTTHHFAGTACWMRIKKGERRQRGKGKGEAVWEKMGDRQCSSEQDQVGSTLWFCSTLSLIRKQATKKLCWKTILKLLIFTEGKKKSLLIKQMALQGIGQCGRTNWFQELYVPLCVSTFQSVRNTQLYYLLAF